MLRGRGPPITQNWPRRLPTTPDPEQVFLPSRLALPSSTTDQGPSICLVCPPLGRAMCPAGQGHDSATRACLKHESEAGLPLPLRVEEMPRRRRFCSNCRTATVGDRLRAPLSSTQTRPAPHTEKKMEVLKLQTRKRIQCFWP